MRAVHDFAGGVTLDDLDAWLLAFSKWVLDPECLFDDPQKIEQLKTLPPFSFVCNHQGSVCLGKFGVGSDSDREGPGLSTCHDSPG